jgi:hypothetical protein
LIARSISIAILLPRCLLLLMPLLLCLLLLCPLLLCLLLPAMQTSVSVPRLAVFPALIAEASAGASHTRVLAGAALVALPREVLSQAIVR